MLGAPSASGWHRTSQLKLLGRTWRRLESTVIKHLRHEASPPEAPLRHHRHSTASAPPSPPRPAARQLHRTAPEPRLATSAVLSCRLIPPHLDSTPTQLNSPCCIAFSACTPPAAWVRQTRRRQHGGRRGGQAACPAWTMHQLGLTLRWPTCPPILQTPLPPCALLPTCHCASAASSLPSAPYPTHLG